MSQGSPLATGSAHTSQNPQCSTSCTFVISTLVALPSLYMRLGTQPKGHYVSHTVCLEHKVGATTYARSQYFRSIFITQLIIAQTTQRCVLVKLRPRSYQFVDNWNGSDEHPFIDAHSEPQLAGRNSDHVTLWCAECNHSCSDYCCGYEFYPLLGSPYTLVTYCCAASS
jgi:hypothetical protein